MNNEEKYEMLINPKEKDLENYKEYRKFLDEKILEIRKQIEELEKKEKLITHVIHLDLERQKQLQEKIKYNV